MKYARRRTRQHSQARSDDGRDQALGRRWRACSTNAARLSIAHHRRGGVCRLSHGAPADETETTALSFWWDAGDRSHCSQSCWSLSKAARSAAWCSAGSTTHPRTSTSPAAFFSVSSCVFEPPPVSVGGTAHQIVHVVTVVWALTRALSDCSDAGLTVPPRTNVSRTSTSAAGVGRCRCGVDGVSGLIECGIAAASAPTPRVQ